MATEVSARRGSVVAELRAERSGTGHEGATAASDFFTAGVEEDAIGDVKALGTTDHVAAGKEMAAGDGAEEIKLEGRREDEEIGDAGLDGEERGVVEGFEVDSAVNGLGGVMEILADGKVQFGPALLGNSKARPKPFIDGRGVVHADQCFEVSRGHGFVVLKLLRPGKTEKSKAKEFYTKDTENRGAAGLGR